MAHNGMQLTLVAWIKKQIKQKNNGNDKKKYKKHRTYNI